MLDLSSTVAPRAVFVVPLRTLYVIFTFFAGELVRRNHRAADGTVGFLLV